ncbi:MAG: pyridoxal phosphate-dependent aminotransferase family protein [Myxococcales bacterium]|nr:pyridoxal phosphate-dependent aminotransferase family protein [Myxococcales bacterium]
MATPSDLERLASIPLDSFEHTDSRNLFEKCERFHAYASSVRELGAFQVQYRIELLGPLDARITVRDAFTGDVKEMICFDSNSYLGLHLDPRVNEAVKKAVDDVGFGTPSAQVLGGTNRYLRALEDRLSELHKREETLIYPSGYQANVGILTALMDPGDLAVVDHVSHASIHDGVRYAGCRSMEFPYRDVHALDALLAEHREEVNGVLIVTDGMFSMHGGLADLPGLRRVADTHDARLMIDDAHSLGVIGPTGLGIEEHYDLEGAVDVLMGTFSKAPGAAGGYVSGDSALIEYLRFMSRGALFTATLPAPTCAGVLESIRIMHEEPEHRERLWANARRFHAGARAAGLEVPELESPIVAIQVGDEKWLIPLAFALYEAGVKCGIARYPAVPHHHSILRFTMNARHTEADIDHTLEVLASLWAQLGIG